MMSVETPAGEVNRSPSAGRAQPDPAHYAVGLALFHEPGLSYFFLH